MSTLTIQPADNNQENMVKMILDALHIAYKEEKPSKKKLSELAGKLPHHTAEELLKFVEEERKGWDDRLKQQL